MIPKIIHYCWFGGKKLPRDVKKCIKSWKKYCPEYKIIEWNENNTSIEECEFASAAYNNKEWAFVSDYVRLKVVYDYGGIYLDTDVELLKNIDFLLEEKCFLATDQLGKRIATGLGFGAEKNNPLIKEMLEVYYYTSFDVNKKREIQCPILNTNVIKKYGFEFSTDIRKYSGATVYPPKYFDPLGTGNSQDLLGKDTVSIHHYSASWTSGRQRLKRKFVNLLGYSNIQRIKKIIYQKKGR